MSTTAIPVALERGESPARRALRRFFQHKLAVFGLVVVLAFVLIALLAPWIAPFDPIETSWTRIRKPPSALYWFGTDELGRDMHVERVRDVQFQDPEYTRVPRGCPGPCGAERTLCHRIGSLAILRDGD